MLPRPASLRPRARGVTPLKSPNKLAEVASCRWRWASRRRGWRQPGECRRPQLARAVAKLTFEGTAEAGGVCKTQILGDRRDRLRIRRIGQHRMRFEQPLTLNVSGDTSGILEQSIEIRSRHADQPAEDRRPESRGPQVLANDPPHSLFASHVDLRPNDGDTPGRRGDCGGRLSRQPLSQAGRGRPRSPQAGGVREPSYSRRADAQEACPGPTRKRHRATALYLGTRRAP